MATCCAPRDTSHSSIALFDPPKVNNWPSGEKAACHHLLRVRGVKLAMDWSADTSHNLNELSCESSKASRRPSGEKNTETIELSSEA